MNYFNFKFYLIIFIISIPFFGCGSYNFDKTIEQQTYIQGTVSLPSTTYSLQHFAPQSSRNNSIKKSADYISPIAGALVYTDYAGSRYQSTTDENGNFKLYINEQINTKQIYHLTIEKGLAPNMIVIPAYIVSDDYGNVNNININEKNIVNYFIIKKFLDNWKEYYIEKENINFEIFDNNNSSERLLTDLILNEVPLTNLDTNRNFISVLNNCINNFNGVVATIPYNNQQDFDAFDEIKIFFGSQMDTTIYWTNYINFNQSVVSSYNLTAIWDKRGSVLTLRPTYTTDSFLKNIDIILYINEKLKTAAGQKIKPFTLKFHTIDTNRFNVKHYFNLKNYYEYTYTYHGENSPVEVQYTNKLLAPQILNSKTVYTIGRDINNYETYTNDENGLQIHSAAINGKLYNYYPSVKLCSAIAHPNEEIKTHNTAGDFICIVREKTFSTGYPDIMKIEMKYKHYDESFYHQKFLYFAKGIGIIKIQDIGYYEQTLLNYKNYFQIISPDSNSIVDKNGFEIKWMPVSNYSRYRIDLSKTPNFSTINSFYDTTTTSVSVIPNDSGQYYFRIKVLKPDSTVFLISDTYPIFITETKNLNPAFEVENGFGDYLYQKIIPSGFPVADKIKFYLTKSPTNMIVDSDTGLVVWTPAKLDKGLFDVQIRIFDLNNMQSNYYNYKIYLLPATIINSFRNTSDTLTFYEDNSFKKVSSEIIYNGLYSVYLDTITFNYTSPFITTEIGREFYLGYDTLSYILNNDLKIYNLVVYDTTIVDTTIQPILNPIITSTPKTVAYINKIYLYWVKVKGVYSDIFTYELITKPDEMTIDNNGLIYWKPKSRFLNTNPDVTVRVTEKNGGKVTQSYIITVRE